MKRLAIISHTEHYISKNGDIVGWGPTVNELNHLLEIFDVIYHVAMFHEKPPPPSSLPYQSNKIIFVPLPALGGKTMGDKVKILTNAFKVIRIVNDTLKKADCFQLRTPTGIGVCLIPYLTLFVKKKGWYKYAGNWNQKQPPLGYRFQRWFLKNQSRKVTINGKWPDQPNNCITFENPCLSNLDLLVGQELIEEKTIEGNIQMCYVGRLETPKGVGHIIAAIGKLSEAEKKRISAVHLVGNGAEVERFKLLSKSTGVNFIFHGFLSRVDVFKIYKKSQVFLMPTTASEGFPKVIAEAMNFGCLPVVSTISSIGQYIKDMETGLCIENVNNQEVLSTIKRIFQLKNRDYQNMMCNQRDTVNRFTFEHYNQRIVHDILMAEEEL